MVSASKRKIPHILSGLAAFLTLGVAGYSLLNLSVYRPSTPDTLIPGAVSQDLVSFLAAFGLLLCIILIRRGRKMAWLIWVGTLGLSVLIGALLAPWFGQAIDPASVGIYALLGLGPLLFVVPFLRSMRIEQAALHEEYKLQGV